MRASIFDEQNIKQNNASFVGDIAGLKLTLNGAEVWRWVKREQFGSKTSEN
jgi:hypothetical protein